MLQIWGGGVVEVVSDWGCWGVFGGMVLGDWMGVWMWWVWWVWWQWVHSYMMVLLIIGVISWCLDLAYSDQIIGLIESFDDRYWL